MRFEIGTPTPRYTGTRMTFEELGTVLRTEREKRGVSIDEVAAHLKISVRVIRALEEGDTISLPHAVYVRGFIRSYGTYLGLSGDELTEAMDTVAPEDPPVASHSVYTSVDDAVPSSGKIFCTLALLACLAGLGLFWFYRDADLFSDDGGRSSIPATAQPAPPVEPRPSPVPPSHVNDAPAAQQSAVAGSSSQSPMPTRRNPPLPTPSSTDGSTAASPLSPPQQSAVPQTSQMQSSDQHKIIITALAECWIHSNADDTDTRQFSLRKGDTFALAFSRKLTLKLGNAGGVRIRYDGQDLPAPGGDGQVRTLIFPPAQ